MSFAIYTKINVFAYKYKKQMRFTSSFLPFFLFDNFLVNIDLNFLEGIHNHDLDNVSKLRLLEMYSAK